MSTSRETILFALHARLSALFDTAIFGDVLSERLPVECHLIQRSASTLAEPFDGL